MIFPAELKFDYVRVYQRKGQSNVGCDPSNYPTADYIANHPVAYSSASMAIFYVNCTDYDADPNGTAWPYEKPKNSMVSTLLLP